MQFALYSRRHSCDLAQMVVELIERATGLHRASTPIEAEGCAKISAIIREALRDRLQALLSISGPLFLAFPTSLLHGAAAISSDSYGLRRSTGRSIVLPREPSVIVSRVKDDRHTVVNRRH